MSVAAPLPCPGVAADLAAPVAVASRAALAATHPSHRCVRYPSRPQHVYFVVATSVAAMFLYVDGSPGHISLTSWLVLSPEARSVRKGRGSQESGETARDGSQMRGGCYT